LRTRLTILTLLVICLIVTGALVFATLDTLSATENEYILLKNYTERNAIIMAGLTDRGMALEDARFDPLMEKGLRELEEAFTDSGGDPAGFNLTPWKSWFSSWINGEIDLYIINESGIIVATTHPDVAGLDFRRAPAFFSTLSEVRNGSAFKADRFVPSWASANATGVHGTIRKFAYYPSADHRYVLEMGVISPLYTTSRQELSYQVMADGLMQDNHLVSSIRIFDIYRNILATTGSPVLANNSPELTLRLETALRERTTTEYRNPSGDSVTRYQYIDLSNNNTVTDPSIVMELTYRTTPLTSAVKGVLERYFIIGLVSIILGAVIAFFSSRRLSQEVRRMVGDIEVIANGSLDHRIGLTATAEFQDLTRNINLMVSKIREYSAEIEKERSERSIAARIQQAFLPKEIPQVQGYQIDAFSRPAREVGGDFYDIIPLSEGQVGLMIADVSGKGLPASLYMAFSRTIVRTMARMSRKACRIISRSNTEFCDDAGEVAFVTLFFGILDPVSGQLTYTNAGHNPPLLLRADGQLERLSPTGPAIGIDSESVFSERQILLHEGDLLVLYTDGISEAMDESGRILGESRLEARIIGLSGLPPSEVISLIRKEVEDFVDGASQSDDITLMAVVVSTHERRTPDVRKGS
jgi:serine phosphatase RsbU (regulator of sigma subunit)